MKQHYICRTVFIKIRHAFQYLCWLTADLANYSDMLMKEVNSTTPENASDTRCCSYRRQSMWAECGLQELERTNCNYLKYRLFYDAIIPQAMMTKLVDEE